MPRTQSITKKMIYEAALALLREKGLDAFTARNIAAHIGCSTQPIYRVYKNLDELKKEVYIGIGDIFDKEVFGYTKTGRGYMDNSLGYLNFAVNDKQLFQLTCITRDANINIVVDSPCRRGFNDLREDIGGDITDDEVWEMLYQFATLTHGLAVLYATGAVEYDAEDAERLLKKQFRDEKAGFMAAKNAR